MSIIKILAGVIFLLAAGALFLAALSRHKKAGMGPVALSGVGRVHEALAPEGAIILNGELWRARSHDGVTISPGTPVRVVGAAGHLLEVAPATPQNQP